jgi:thioesterase domain-containing protein
MPRKIRVEYPGTIYHVLSRGDKGENIFLERMDRQLGNHHSGQLRQESAEAKAEQIVEEELDRLGWKELDLTSRRKSDPGKLALAARLRTETTLSIKSIAARVHLGSSKSANVKLHQYMRASTQPPSQPG